MTECCFCHKAKPPEAFEFLQGKLRAKTCMACVDAKAVAKENRQRICRRCLWADRPATKPLSQFYAKTGPCKECIRTELRRRTDNHETRPGSGECKPLADIDETPCSRCHLRGHEAGDPDRCIQLRSGDEGLGQWPTGW